MTQYAIWLCDTSFARVALLANTDQMRTWSTLTYRQALNGMSGATIEMNAASSVIDSIAAAQHLQIYRDNVLAFGGIIVAPSWGLGESAPMGDSYTVRALDHTAWAKWRIVLPPSGLEQDRRAGPADDVAKAYVYNHAGAGAAVARRTSGLTVQANASACTSIIEEARYDNLLTLLETLAGAGGTFRWRFVPASTGAEFRTAVAWGTDRRKNNAGGNTECIFSLDRHTITQMAYTLDIAEHYNFLYVAGQGAGIERNVQTVTTAGDVTLYGRREKLIEATQLSLTSSLLARGAAALEELKPGEAMTITPRVGTWGSTWGLGDYVTLYANRYGRTFTLAAEVMAVNVAVGVDGVEYATPELEAL